MRVVERLLAGVAIWRDEDQISRHTNWWMAICLHTYTYHGVLRFVQLQPRITEILKGASRVYCTVLIRLVWDQRQVQSTSRPKRAFQTCQITQCRAFAFNLRKEPVVEPLRETQRRNIVSELTAS